MEILRYLSDNGRMSNAELGRMLNLSRAAVRERVNSLVEKGVIDRFTIIVDPRKAGTLLSVYLNIEVEWLKLESVANEISEYAEITNVYQMSGKPHLHSHGMFDDPDHVGEFINKLQEIEGITHITSELLLRRFKEQHSILI
ncbi:AsnC family transcriptional regulator [Ammoniphilus oxalaticus]|uniref:AsnC family transcriptional regulator n=2 Tax=Ammoniphilus oxalaticus TaxID=66863 RepID=A0A419SHG7_9BACL|nr:AsnC family transcriptional regulator [Ammoniphilus oxalaticus]